MFDQAVDAEKPRVLDMEVRVSRLGRAPRPWCWELLSPVGTPLQQSPRLFRSPEEALSEGRAALIATLPADLRERRLREWRQR